MIDLIANLYTVLAPTLFMTIILSPLIFDKYLFSKRDEYCEAEESEESGSGSEESGSELGNELSVESDEYCESDDELDIDDKIHTKISFPNKKEYGGLLYISFTSNNLNDLKNRIEKIEYNNY